MAKVMAIVGYRDFHDKVEFDRLMNHLIVTYDIMKDVETIVSGGATGVDSLAKLWAEARNIDFIEIKPDYAKYGKVAPLIRNGEIVDKADFVVAMVSIHSRGTLNTIAHAKKQHKKCYIVNLD
jgi:predicted Rossmann fold nucleotide-binding protein DprA/Smf involved in DNA uptake